MATAAPQGKCCFCANLAKYTCPRCNIQYCSSACYKHENHLQCSEGFYKDQVKEQLEGTTVSEESRKRMLEILNRVERGEEALSDNEEPLDSDDDEEEEELSSRMRGIDLNDSNAVWKLLSEAEREEFRELVKSGNYGDLVPTWSPWWEQNVPLVQDISEGNPDIAAYATQCPPLVDVPVLSEVTTITPSPCIPFNILNVITSYAWMVRLFNGDHEESSLDATEALLSLSTVLAANANFEDASMAVESPRMEAQNHLWLMESEEFASTVKSDAKKILIGPTAADQTFYIRAALSDIHAVLNTSKTSLSRKKKAPHNAGYRKGLFTGSFPEATQYVEQKLTSLQSVKLCLKKVEYLLSYIKEYSSHLVSLIPV
ncbi:hypothetical protein SK128_007090 [Halocaridina rubra]|uniref:HIT-type domain-containing protein n=1 Tax=Halocaridina rubra TaxID=373956 RepID=A0AAN8XMV3_HALRR